jgi:hypothetical protein
MEGDARPNVLFALLGCLSTLTATGLVAFAADAFQFLAVLLTHDMTSFGCGSMFLD